MIRFSKLVYPEHRYFEGDKQLQKRVQKIMLSRGFGGRRQMTLSLLFFGIPVYVISMSLFFYLQRNPVLWPGVDPWLVTLATLALCAAFGYFARHKGRRNLRRALVRCDIPICIDCGYDLASREPSRPCPECGAPYPEPGSAVDSMGSDGESEP